MGAEKSGNGSQNAIEQDMKSHSGLAFMQPGTTTTVNIEPTPPPPRARILGDLVYTPTSFAKILGVTRHELIEKEAEGIIPPAKRNAHQERYYNPEDVVLYRQYLGLPSPVPLLRKQLFLNFKGGTGKSTVSASYGFRLAQMGVRTLFIDLDPQGHLTQCLGLNSA